MSLSAQTSPEAAGSGHVQKEERWTALPGSQVGFLECEVFEVLYEGTRGPGKTDSLLMDFMQHTGVGWGIDWRGVLFRHSHPALEDFKNKCKRWIPRFIPGARYNESKSVWTFPDGEELLLRHMRVPSDYDTQHGSAFPWIGFEELTKWADPSCYKLMMSTSRSTVPASRRDIKGRPMPRKVRATTNPYGRGHNWVKTRFRLPYMRGHVITDAVDQDGNKEPDRVAIYGHLWENKILLEAEPDYIQKVTAAARNENERRAWLYGDWEITAGGMFDDLWDPRYHVIDDLLPNHIPSTWRIYRSFDWGSARPFSVGYWAVGDGSDLVLPDGRVMATVRGDRFRVKEWYGSHGGGNDGLRMEAGEVAEGIIRREKEWGLRDRYGRPTKVWSGPADKSIWDVDGGPSIANEMAKRRRVDNVICPGVTWIKSEKGPGSRENGWQEMRSLFKNAKPSKDGPREMPGIFVCRGCVDWIRTVPVLPRDEIKLDDVDTDAEDHAGDETRYMVTTPLGKRVRLSTVQGV